MPTQCNPDALLFAPVEGRSVVASFTGGAITSDAGALLLGATDRAIGLVERFAACFQDARNPDLIEHELPTLIGQRVFGIALGYEDLIDHDQLRRRDLRFIARLCHAASPPPGRRQSARGGIYAHEHVLSRVNCGGGCIPNLAGC